MVDIIVYDITALTVLAGVGLCASVIWNDSPIFTTFFDSGLLTTISVPDFPNVQPADRSGLTDEQQAFMTDENGDTLTW